MKNKFSKFINLQGKYLTSLLFVLFFAVGQMWGAASTTTDDKSASGTIDFSTIGGTLSTNTTYWYNGVKFFTGGAQSASASNSRWGSNVSVPCFVENVTAGKDANKGSWGAASNGKLYSMSGFACNQYTIGIHVNQACTITAIVNRNLGSDTDDAGITASIDATAYATAWTTSTYKVAGTALTVTSSREDKTNKPGRYTLTIPVTNGNLTDGQAVVKMFYSSGGSGAGKLFCWESITVTPATVTKHSVTYALNGGTGVEAPTQADVAEGAKFTVANMPTGVTAPTGKVFDGWSDGTNKYNGGAEYTMGTSNVTLTAQWKDASVKSNDATLSALSVAGCTLNEDFDPATTAYTISLPFYGTMPVVGDVTATKNDANAKTPEISISGNVITVVGKAEDNTTTKTYTITVNIAATPTASSSLNLEQNVLDNGKSWGVAAALTAANIVVDGTNGLDSLNDDPSKSARNYPYLGLKFKKKDADIIKIVVPANNVLNVKFGNVGIALTTTVNGAAGAGVAKASSGTFHLDAAANVREVVFRSSAAQTVTLQQVKIGAEFDAITLPWKVTYDAGEHGTCATTKEVWTGTALTLPAVTPESGWDFDGWFDGENKVTSPYNPGKNADLVAHYTAQAAGTDLSTLTYQIGTGSPAEVGYSAGTFIYNIELPYKASYDAITVAATPVTGASIKDDATKILTVSSLPGTATFTVTDGVSEQLYTVNFKKAAKDGVSIIKATINSTTKNTIGEVTGLYKKDASCGGLSSYKFNGKGAYIGIELVAGQTFNEGDIINIHTTSAAGQGTIALYNDHGNTVSSFHDYGVMGGTGDNKFALPASAEEKSLIYVCRTEANTWNGYVDYIEVLRAMNPVLTAITINGEACEKGTGDAFSVTLANGTPLGSLTVVPTIVKNGEGGSAAPTAAWAWGANTYRVTDKDGDYTDYTITLTEAPAPVDPVLTYNNGAYIVGLTTLDLSTLIDEKESTGAITYTVKEKNGTNATIDGTTFTATAAGTAVVTASQAAAAAYNAITVDFNVVVTVPTEVDGIKMVEGGNLTGKFVSGRTLANGNNTVEGIAYTKYITMSSAMTSFGNEVAPSASKGIYYYPSHKNIRFYFYVNNVESSAKNINIYTVDEDAESTSDATSASVAVESGRHMVYADVVLEKHAAVVFGFEKTSTQICQIVAVESGDALLQGGEAGYSIDYNMCYISPKKETVAVYDGIEYKLYNDAKLVSASNVQLQTLGTHYIKFHLDAPKQVSVYADNKKYYIGSECSTGDNAKLYEATGNGEFTLAAGDWYINGSGAQVKINKIEFALPKAAKPVVADMDNVDYCQGGAIDELTVSATVSDGGTMLYQWYKDGVKIDGAEAVTYQPTVDAEYYVVVVNTKAGHQNSDPTQSNTITVTGHAGIAISGTTGAEDWPDAEVTISVTASGKNLHYAWYTCDDAMGTNPVAVAPAVDAAELNVTIAAADTYYKVVVSGDCGDAQEAVITVVARQAVELQDVTGDMSWDFSKANDGSATGSNLCTDEVLANVHGINNNDDFKSAYLKATANKFSSGKLQASMIMFHTTVNGVVTVVFSHTGNNKTDGRALVVNGTYQSALSHNQTAMTYTFYVPAGDVVLTSTTGDGGAMLNFTSVDFKVKATPDYTRNVTNNIGTLCVDHNVLVGGALGATFYQIASRNELYDYKIDFEEVLPGEELKAGEPYIFQSATGRIDLFFGTTVADEPVAVRGMIGNYDASTLAITAENQHNILYIAQNKLWTCENLVGQNLILNEHRAYINMAQVPTYAQYQEAQQQQQNSAPRRRVTLGKDEAQVVTGFGELETSETPVKVLINGQIFIIRGEKMFGIDGKLIK